MRNCSLEIYAWNEFINVNIYIFSESSIARQEITQNTANNTYKVDQTLDSIPVRQPKSERTYEKPLVTNLFPNNMNNVSNLVKPQVMDVSRKHDKSTINKVPVNTQKCLNQTNQKFPTSKPTDILLRNLQSSFRPITDDTECSTENSLSISKIADYLGKNYDKTVIKY